MRNDHSALELLRASRLMPDGPVTWGQPVRSRQPGIFVVELSAGLEAAPIDHGALRAWLERAPELRLDGEAPTPNTLAARLASFWLPHQRVLYVGRTAKSLGGRVAATCATRLGDRRPHSGGHWLKTLQGLDRLRVWWAETEAPEEYEDALLALFAEGVPVVDRGTQPSGSPLLPWAVLETSTGERRETGITGYLAPEPAEAGAGVTGRRVGASPGGSGSAHAARGRGAAVGRDAAVGRGSAPARPSGAVAARARSPARPRLAGSNSTAGARRASTSRRSTTETNVPRTEATHVTGEGLKALEAELEELRTLKRPEVILRVKGARELGDLRENADYEAARNEQSFLEGRIRTVEQMIRSAVVIAADRSGEVMLGSTVRVDADGDEVTFHIVGSTEADPATGRISNQSPVGKALLGHRAGQEVTAHLPGRELRYRILAVE